MDAPPGWRRCHCQRWGKRIFTPPQFTEDRQRLFRNPVDGTKFSWTLGKEMPESRKEYERELAAVGCEPVSPHTMPQAWKDNIAYKQHVESGGERDRAFETQRHPAAVKAPTVLEQLKKSDVRIA